MARYQVDELRTTESTTLYHVLDTQQLNLWGLEECFLFFSGHSNLENLFTMNNEIVLPTDHKMTAVPYHRPPCWTLPW